MTDEQEAALQKKINQLEMENKELHRIIRSGWPDRQQIECGTVGKLRHAISDIPDEVVVLIDSHDPKIHWVEASHISRGNLERGLLLPEKDGKYIAII